MLSWVLQHTTTNKGKMYVEKRQAYIIHKVEHSSSAHFFPFSILNPQLWIIDLSVVELRDEEEDFIQMMSVDS